MTDTIEQQVERLSQRITVLEAEADIRRLQARYMFLCDTPLPEYGLTSDARRIDAIMELYTDDAVWEGVGEYYDGQFGRAEGAPATTLWLPALRSNAFHAGSSRAACDCRRPRHSTRDLRIKVSKASSASSEATANAAANWYSL